MKEMLNPAQEGPTAGGYEFQTRLYDHVNEGRTDTIIRNRLGINPLEDNEKTYASGEVKDAFDWDDIYEKVTTLFDLPKDKELFVFAFYSEPNELTPEQTEALNIADLDSFDEARCNSPEDFLYYFRGLKDDNGNVISFCIWTSLEEAHTVYKGKAHQVAMKLATPTYKNAKTQGHTLKGTGDGQPVELKFEFEHVLELNN